jgi:O-acetylhomoserine/O-acetylserine sulfhydrylase-like pyridoxal-dependent enzyme
MTISPDDIRICIEDQPARQPGIEPMATPIVQTSLFAFESLEALVAAGARENKHTVYTRGQNPTVEVLEKKLAALEQGEACKAFGSGMAAISAVIMGLLQSGDHILFVNNTYGPALQLAKQLGRFGITHTLLLDIEPDDVRAALLPNTKLIWLGNRGHRETAWRSHVHRQQLGFAALSETIAARHRRSGSLRNQIHRRPQ